MMMETAHSPYSRHALRIQSATAWTALFAVPLIWMVHLVVCLELLSTACAGGVTQSGELPWDEVEHFIDFVSAVAFAVCLALAIATGRAWRRLASQANSKSQSACFVAWCSATAAVVFTGALAFTACVLIAAPFDSLCAPFQ
ncbi:hypothetical protein PWR63_26680 [Paraburkholderia sp. A2WS-5]|uniref:hypothetical protein n=1 Tax=unclassified Paraburkholderia TaxID=2615204 RepID=UPI003B80E3BD